MTRTLGSFSPAKNLIRISHRLQELGSGAEQAQVVKHEVAHAIAHHQSPGARAHGREFREACRSLGIKPGRYVDVDLTAWSKRTRYVTGCPECGAEILRKRRVARVRCACGAGLRPANWTLSARR